MTIEFKKGLFFRYLWFVGQDGLPIDFLGALYQEGEKEYFKFRVRFHSNESQDNTEQLFRDKKLWYSVEFDNQEEALEKIQILIQNFTKTFGGEVNTIELNCDGDEAGEKFSKLQEDWIHKFQVPHGMSADSFTKQMSHYTQN